MKLTPLLSLCGLLALLPHCGGGNCCYKSAPACPAETAYEPTVQQASEVVVEQAAPQFVEPVAAPTAALEPDEEFEELEEPKAPAEAPAVEDEFAEETTETK